MELFGLTLLFPFHVIDSILCPKDDTAANDKLQYEDEDEGQGVPTQRQLLLPILLLVRGKLCLLTIDNCLILPSHIEALHARRVTIL